MERLRSTGKSMPGRNSHRTYLEIPVHVAYEAETLEPRHVSPTELACLGVSATVKAR